MCWWSGWLDVYKRQLQYGSPKKPAILEALALNFADNADAKMETMIEVLQLSLIHI